MSDYIVTARKFRPMRFEDVAAQDHVTVTLRNAIATKRLAHAYLFGGPRGVGKTTTARILAKAVNCLHPIDNNPDNECSICQEITEGRSFDVLEIDGASNRGVDEIRNLRESVRYPPSQGKYKVYIIDEVHMLTKEAFNALLKTLEEPPPHVLFIFATTELHKLPATILSRCQRFDFRRISIDEIIRNLRDIAAKEKIQIDDDSLLLVAKRGDGSLRDSQSIFDQVVALCGRAVTHQQILQALNIVDTEFFFRITDLVKAKDAKGGLQLVEELMSRGHDLKEFLTGLTEHLRNLLIAKTTSTTALIEASELHRKRYLEEAAKFTVADILRILRQVSATEGAIRWSAQPRFKLEADLVQMITTHTAPEVGDLLQRIEELKKKLDEPRQVASPHHPISTEQTATRPNTPLKPQTTLPPRQTQGARVEKASAIPVSPTPKPTALVEGEVVSRWTEFVGEVRRQRISLGSVLESASLLGVNGTSIRLGCANDFQASSISRNRELITATIQKIFSANARLEVEITSNPQALQTTFESPATPAASTQPDEHPIVKAMMRELGAEPLQ